MNTNNRLSQLSLDAAEAAVARALKFCKEGNAVWCPVFADVMSLDGIKLGHIVSDGYTHRTWSFFPRIDIRKLGRGDTYRDRYAQKEAQKINPVQLHRCVSDKAFDVVVPKWAGRYTLSNVETYQEGNERRAAEKAA